MANRNATSLCHSLLVVHPIFIVVVIVPLISPYTRCMQFFFAEDTGLVVGLELPYKAQVGVQKGLPVLFRASDGRGGVIYGFEKGEAVQKSP